MASLIEEYIEEDEEIKEMKEKEEVLKKEIAELEEKLKDTEGFSDHLTIFLKPGTNHKEVFDIIKEKVKNDKLQERIEELEKKFGVSHQ